MEPEALFERGSLVPRFHQNRPSKTIQCLNVRPYPPSSPCPPHCLCRRCLRRTPRRRASREIVRNRQSPWLSPNCQRFGESRVTFYDEPRANAFDSQPQVNYDPTQAANMEETGAFAVLAPGEPINVTHDRKRQSLLTRRA